MPEPNIQRLGYDNLAYIFSFLSVSERVKIERVCKQWEDVAKNSWSDFKKLNLSVETWGKCIFGPEQAVTKCNDHILQKVLSRCNNYIKSIELIYYNDFEYSNNKLYEENFDLSCLAKCPNLEKINLKAPKIILTSQIKNMVDVCNNISQLNLAEIKEYKIDAISCNSDFENKLITLCSKNKKLQIINLNNIFISDNLLKSFSTDSINAITIKETISFENPENYLTNLKNLKILSVNLDNSMGSKTFLSLISGVCFNITELSLDLNKKSYEHELAKLFAVSKLQKLSLKNTNMTGICLLNLKDEYIKAIKLLNCNFIEYSHLISILYRLKNLCSIKLNFSCDSPSMSQCLEAISKQSHLEKLYWNKSSISPNYILQLKNLKILSIRSNQLVTDEFLSAVSKFMLNLVHVNVECCYSVTDEGLREVSKLPKLKHFLFTGVHITGEGFSLMPNLVTLSCYYSVNIKQNYLCKIVENSVNLQYLNIFYCSSISNEFFKFANRIVSKRPHITLTIFFKRANRVVKDIKISDNLKLIDEKNSFYYSFKDTFELLKLSKL